VVGEKVDHASRARGAAKKLHGLLLVGIAMLIYAPPRGAVSAGGERARHGRRLSTMA